MTTIAELTERLARAEKQNERIHKKAAAANIEAEALRGEVRRLRHANFILQSNIENQESAGYKVRFQKAHEALLMIREITRVEATGIPEQTPTTLEPWLGPRWSRKPKAVVLGDTEKETGEQP